MTSERCGSHTGSAHLPSLSLALGCPICFRKRPHVTRLWQPFAQTTAATPSIAPVLVTRPRPLRCSTAHSIVLFQYHVACISRRSLPTTTSQAARLVRKSLASLRLLPGVPRRAFIANSLLRPLSYTRCSQHATHTSRLPPSSQSLHQVSQQEKRIIHFNYT